MIVPSRIIHRHAPYPGIILGRFMSNDANPLVKVHMSTNSAVASLVLNRPPVNSLSLEMCTAISTAIKSLEHSKQVQALVISSSNAFTFSAGLDLMELHNPQEQRLDSFWNSVQQLFLDLYGSRLATIAAIQGHALAAGAMIAMACDYRIMTVPDNKSSPTIGLNEAKFGIVAPSWMNQLLVQTIGFRQAEQALSLGTTFTANDALRIGLIDQVVVPPDTILDTAQAVALEWSKVPPKARSMSKLLTRKTLIESLLQSRLDDTKFFKDYILQESVQHGLAHYLESLKRKK